MLTTNTSTNSRNGGDEEEEAEEATPHQLVALASLLEALVARNDDLLRLLLLDDDQLRDGEGTLDAFRASRAASISIGKYLERIYKYTLCSPACFVAAFVYVDRLMHKHPRALVASLNVYRLVLTSLLVASKVLEDV